MNAETPIDLITLEAKDAFAVFTTDDPETALAPILAKVRGFIDAWERPDVATEEGRKEIASMAYKIARSKGKLEKTGLELAREAKKVPGKIDATRRHIETVLDGWRDEVRAPLDAWEKAEAARKAEHKAVLDVLTAYQTIRTPDLSIDCLSDRIAWVEAVAPDAHEEFAGEIEIAKDAALAVLKPALAAREKADAEAAELAALRKEKAERDAKEAEEKRKRDEEAASARREQELRDAAEKAATAAAAKAKADLEAKQRAEQEAADKRAKSTAHRRKVNREAVADLTAKAGLTEEAAIALVTLIAKGEVANVSINY